MMTHWSYLTIIERPGAPAPEKDLRYTVRLHFPDGLSMRVENVRTAKILWPKFDAEPALKVGEIDPETGEESDGTHPVQWVGQKWYPWIIHVPKANQCPQSGGGNFSSEMLRAIVREEFKRLQEAASG